MDAREPRHRDPIIFDTLVLLGVQCGFYILSRRFLLHALPTLRNISKQGTESEGTTDSNDVYALRTYRGRNQDDEDNGAYTEEEGDGLLNASGGFSDVEAGSSTTRDPSSSRQRWKAGFQSDSDDDMSEATRSYAGSPLPSPSVELAGHDGDGAASTASLMKQEAGLAMHSAQDGHNADSRGHARRISALNGVQLPAIRTPGTPATPSTPGSASQGRKQEPQVLRIFKPRDSGAKAGTNSKKEKEKVGATRGLGFLARNLFSICFAESLTLLSLVMFHSIGILHSRSRHVHFSISLHILLLLILFVVPWVQCMQLTYRAREASKLHFGKQSASGKRRLSVAKRILVSLVPFGLYIFLFTRIPPYVTTLDAPLVPEAELESIIRAGNISQVVNGTRKIPGYRLKAVLPQMVHLGDLSDLDESEQPLGNVEDSRQDHDEGNDYTYEEYEYAFEYYSQQQLWRKGGWLEPSLGRVVVCGVVVLGGLSGLGAVRTAWNFIESGGMGSGRMITREDLISAERALYRVRHDMVYKRGELTRRLGGNDQRDGTSTDDQGWMSRVFDSTLGRNQETNALRREIQGLEALEQQISRGLDAMKLRRKRQRFAQTLRGRLFNLVGMLFTVYCIARVMMCGVSVVFPPLASNKLPRTDEQAPDNVEQGKGNTNGDWISYLIAWGLSRLPTGVVDVGVWSRAISLLLTGLLIMSSLLQVLRSVSKVLRLTSKKIGAGFLLLTLGQLMSTYTISLLIQLRSFIPPSMPDLEVIDQARSNSTAITTAATQFSQFKSHGDTSLLASLPEFRVFGRLFDIMFLVGAISTALYRFLSQRMNGVDEYAQVYH